MASRSTKVLPSTPGHATVDNLVNPKAQPLNPGEQVAAMSREWSRGIAPPEPPQPTSAAGFGQRNKVTMWEAKAAARRASK
jgi:hypothetical protein